MEAVVFQPLENEDEKIITEDDITIMRAIFYKKRYNPTIDIEEEKKKMAVDKKYLSDTFINYGSQAHEIVERSITKWLQAMAERGYVIELE